MTFCFTLPLWRTEPTMRMYSCTVPLDEGTLTDRMNMTVIITSLTRFVKRNPGYIGQLSGFPTTYYHYAFCENGLSIVGK